MKTQKLRWVILLASCVGSSTSQREADLPLALQQRLTLWLRADRGVEVTDAASGGVGAWRDLKPSTESSGGGHDFVALAPGQQRLALGKAKVIVESSAVLQHTAHEQSLHYRCVTRHHFCVGRNTNSPRLAT
jgi:hypothetical protein